ncbi:MAG: DNA-3-methyladenine glycosylase 2 family protein [Methanomassiliicoccus sp.]|nr:DNA-3-methyladenine glycosylase 2 family protein [Methanomassiliicoccus sp.]
MKEDNLITRNDRPSAPRKEGATGENGGDEHVLVPRAPFCFRKAREAIASFTPGRDQVSVNEAVHRPLRVGGRTVLATIVSHGSIENPRLGVTLAEGIETSGFLSAVADHLSIDDDLEPLYQTGLEDPLFGMVIARLYGLHQVRFISPFASACWAILSAHTFMDAAVSLQSGLLRFCSDSVAGPNGPLWAYPEPSDVLDAGEDKVRGAVLNVRKARYLMSAAKAFHEVDPSFLKAAGYDEARSWLMDIEGIGPWGASLVMVRGLGRMERLPEKDKALAKAASAVYGRKVTGDELETMSERYGQLRAYWAYYLRVAADHPPLEDPASAPEGH